jgi:hypothetical protein
VDLKPVRSSPHVVHVEYDAAGPQTRLRIYTTSVDEFTPELSKIAAAQGWVLREVTPRKQTLEEMFVRITQGPDQPAAREPRPAAPAKKVKARK